MEDLVTAAPGRHRFLSRIGAALLLGTALPALSAFPPPAATPSGPITPAELVQISPPGVANLEALVADRPELLTVIHRGDEIWQWLEVHFSNNGNPVEWAHDPAVKFQHYLAMSSYVRPAVYLAARTLNGSPITPQLELSSLVYELLNISHAPQFRAVVAEARAGNLTEDQFVLAMARIEFSTCQETNYFHQSVWLPYARKNHLPLYRGNWHIGVGNDFGRWIYYHRHVAKDGYPDDAYRPTYRKIAPR